MKVKILSLVATSALLIGTSTHAFANSDSIKTTTTEERIEKSAKELAIESINLATTAVKQASENSKELQQNINNRLDDTIINGKALKERHRANYYADNHNSKLDYEAAMMNKASEILDQIGKGITFFVALIAILIFAGVYLSRRQKYKIIEKAIENNYPLPPGFIGKNLHPTTTTIQHIHYTQEQSLNGHIPAGTKKIKKEFNVSDWANFRSGIKYCAWGISFMWFFIIVDAPVWVFALIPLIIGIGKLLASYKIKQEYNQSKTKEEEIKSPVTPPAFHSEND